MISADPIIMMNKFRKNREYGIHVLCKNNLRSECVIKYNWVERNLEDGICIEGEENYTRIEKNHHITQNRRSGIKVMDGASAKILNN